MKIINIGAVSRTVAHQMSGVVKTINFPVLGNLYKFIQTKRTKQEPGKSNRKNVLLPFSQKKRRGFIHNFTAKKSSKESIIIFS